MTIENSVNTEEVAEPNIFWVGKDGRDNNAFVSIGKLLLNHHLLLTIGDKEIDIVVSESDYNNVLSALKSL